MDKYVKAIAEGVKAKDPLGYQEATIIESADDIEKLKDHMKTGVAEINFRKVDGTHRRLLGTLQSDKLDVAGAAGKKTDRTRAPNPNQMNVWDIENNGWRSFRHDSLISWKPHKE